MIYKIVTENPYTNETLTDNSTGLVITGRWDIGLIDVIEKYNVKVLFLNYTKGWECESYSFLRDIPQLLSINIIDVHSRGISNLESQFSLEEISLNLHVQEKINFDQFKRLRVCFVSWSKYISSIFGLDHIEELYIDNLKTKDNHGLVALKSLTKLTIGNSNITDLSFLRGFDALEILELLNCKKITNFSVIGELKDLKRLNIDGYKDIQSIDFVKTLDKLEVLLLNVGKINSIVCLANLRSLKAVSFNGSTTQIVDGDLEALTTLPKLSMLMLMGRRHYSHKLIKPWNWNNINVPDKLLVPK